MKLQQIRVPELEKIQKERKPKPFTVNPNVGRKRQIHP